MTRPGSTAKPVFVGGTGKSGTTVLGRLIGRHPSYALIPFEMRFHARPTGLPGVLAGHVPPERFVSEMRDRWGWKTVNGDRVPSRLGKYLTAERLAPVLDRFELFYPADRHAACRELVSSLLEPLAAEKGKSHWVEMTPANVSAGSALAAMFPDLKLVHIVRDGRDVAASGVAARRRAEAKGRRTDGKSAQELLHGYWARGLRRAEQGSRGLGPERLLVISFEELMATDRAGGYRRLVEFLELDDDRRMRRFFESRMPAERAHVGHWRRALPKDEAAALDRGYREVLAELHEEEISCAPQEPSSEQIEAGALDRSSR